MTDSNTIYVLLPEILLVITAVWIILAGAFSPEGDGWRWFALSGMAFAACGLYMQGSLFVQLVGSRHAAEVFGPIGFDRLGYLGCWGALALGALLVLQGTGAQGRGPAPEWVASLLLIIAGVMLTAQANDLVLIFLGLELISIPTYVLLYLSRDDLSAREATTKYFFLSLLSGGLTLYGFSFLYGAAGSTSLADLYQAVAGRGASGGPSHVLVRLGLLLAFAGLGFRITMVPFHFYAPDVYQGTSHAAAAMLSAVPKLAGFFVLLRIAAAARPELVSFGWPFFLGLAMLTMTVGNVLALWQKNVRRLMAYSSIAHAGYMLMGIAVWSALADSPAAGEPGVITPQLAVEGLSATFFYLAVYVLATVGAFAALTFLSRRDRQIDSVDELAGLARSNPATAAALAIFMLSLAGLPPLAGFWGKFRLILAALSADVGPTSSQAGLRPWFIALAGVAALNAAIAAAYYLRVVVVMYFRSPRGVPRPEGGGAPALAMVVAALLVLGVGFYPGPLMQRSELAAQGAAVPASGGRMHIGRGGKLPGSAGRLNPPTRTGGVGKKKVTTAGLPLPGW